MHESGKIGISDHILFKANPHSPEEQSIFSTMPFSQPAARLKNSG
jgi:hypothetical protein